MTDIDKLRAMGCDIWNAIDDLICRDDCNFMTDTQVKALNDAIIPILCKHADHNIHMDQCGKPEHDYCLWCEQPFPGRGQSRPKKDD